MLKREEEHREIREAPAAPFTAVLDRPSTVAEPAPAQPLTRAERLAALAAEDERSPRAPQRPGTPMIVLREGVTRVSGRCRRAAQHLADDRQGRVGLPRRARPARASRRSSSCSCASCDATEGSVLVGGRSLEKLRRSKVPQLRRNIGCVFQDFKLLPNRNVFQNVAYALEVQGQDREKIERKVPEILQLVGLGEKLDRLPHELSGGEQQRVSIARAFVNHPALLICDEPTGNLDPDTSVGIMQLLYRINRSGTTVVMATHDREMVDKMRRRVIALEHGRLVRDDRRGGYV